MKEFAVVIFVLFISLKRLSFLFLDKKSNLADRSQATKNQDGNDNSQLPSGVR
jgi:hypothetical protein